MPERPDFYRFFSVRPEEPHTQRPPNVTRAPRTAEIGERSAYACFNNDIGGPAFTDTTWLRDRLGS